MIKITASHDPIINTTEEQSIYFFFGNGPRLAGANFLSLIHFGAELITFLGDSAVFKGTTVPFA